jgi:hypothetical protein
VQLACEDTKEGFTEAVVEEVCKMARAVADELRWRAMEAAVKEMFSPVQAVEDIVAMVRRHGIKARRGPDARQAQGWGFEWRKLTGYPPLSS